MLLEDITQLKRPFVVSWVPSGNIQDDDITPDQYHAFGMTSAAPGAYINEDEIIAVSTTKRGALELLREISAESDQDSEEAWGHALNFIELPLNQYPGDLEYLIKSLESGQLEKID